MLIKPNLMYNQVIVTKELFFKFLFENDFLFATNTALLRFAAMLQVA